MASESKPSNRLREGEGLLCPCSTEVSRTLRVSVESTERIVGARGLDVVIQPKGAKMRRAAPKQAQQACAMGCGEAHTNLHGGRKNADFAVIGAESGFALREPVEAGGFEPYSIRNIHNTRT